MDPLQCTWCKKICKTDGGLSTHSRSCKPRAVGLARMGKASRKRQQEEADIRMVELDELKLKRARLMEEQREWAKRMLSDQVSARSRYSCLRRALWCALRTKVLVYTRGMFENIMTDNSPAYMLQSGPNKRRVRTALQVPVAGPPDIPPPSPPPPSPPAPSPPPELRDLTLPPTQSGRIRKMPKRFVDMVPSALPGQLEFSQAASMLPPQPSYSPEPVAQQCDHTPRPQTPQPPREYFDTTQDRVGFFRRYYYKPARDFKAEDCPDDFIDAANISSPNKASTHYSNPLRAFQNAVSGGTQPTVDWHAPLPSSSVFRLLDWTYDGSNQKSQAEVQKLVDEVLLAPDFDVEQLRGFSMAREERRLDETILSVDSLKAQGWIDDTVYIPVPKENIAYATMEDVPRIAVPGVLRRDMPAIWRAICEDPVLARQRHFNGFEQWHRDPDTGEEQRVLGEVFTSDAFLEEEAKIRSLPRNPADGPEVEYGLLGCGVASDGTHLTNFGAASMTPGYAWDFGLPKAVRSKPTNFASHHFVYMPSVRARHDSQSVHPSHAIIL